jgi:hypothetical protein
MAFNFRDWEKEPELEGIFAGTYKSVGKFKKNVHSFKVRDPKTGKQKIIHTWGLVGINNVLYGVPFKSKIRLKYTGWETMPDSERQFKNFEIEIIDAPDVDDEEDLDETKE